MKTRIAVFSRTRNFWGGSFQYAKAFTEALVGLDPEQFEVQVWHEDDEDWNALCARLGFIEHVLGTYNFPPTFLPAAKKILNSLKRISKDDYAERATLLASLRPFSSDAQIDEYLPHLVISPQMGCPLYQQGAKHIGVIHDLMHRYETRFPEVGSALEISARENLFRSIVSHCDIILVDSRVGFRHVKECYRQVQDDQLQILPFTAFNEVIQSIPHKPDFIVPEKFFFYPAQFWMHKNHTTLARSVALLKNELPDLTVVAAGNTQQNGYASFLDIIAQEQLTERFILPGYISTNELSWLYRHARALVMPTFFGPTNIPPLEAMALGCPVAVSGIYGMPEQCGNAALYFKPDDPADLAEVLRRLWTDDALCLDLKEKGLARSQLYDVSKFNKQVLRIIKNLRSAKIEKTGKREGLWGLELERQNASAKKDAVNRPDTTPRTSRPRPGSECPQWSVIIPTAGRAASLKRTLRSLCRQTLDPRSYEILVVNNGSHDEASDAIARAAMEKFPEHTIRLLKAFPPGLLSGRHLGAMESRAPILTFVDDDITTTEDYGAHILRAFSDRAVHLAGGPCLPAYEAEPPKWLETFWTRRPGMTMCSWLSLINLGGKPRMISPSYIWGLNFSIRKETLMTLGGFHPDNVPTEYQMYQGDGESGLTNAAECHGFEALYSPDVKVWHIVPASRLTESYFKNRAFYQGVCDSYTAVRKNGKHTPAPPLPRHADPNIPEDLESRVHNAYTDGWFFHQNAIRKSPQLRQWVLKKNYWDYSYPELEKGLTFPREWSGQLLENPARALRDPAWALHLALQYGRAGRLSDGLRAALSVERAFPEVAEAKAVRAVLLKCAGKSDDVWDTVSETPLAIAMSESPIIRTSPEEAPPVTEPEKENFPA